MIPGLAMFTARAEPLATWMTGLEVAFFKVRAPGRAGVFRCVVLLQSRVVLLCVFPFALPSNVPLSPAVWTAQSGGSFFFFRVQWRIRIQFESLFRWYFQLHVAICGEGGGGGLTTQHTSQ